MPLPVALIDAVGGRRWRRNEGGESGGSVYLLSDGIGPDLYLKYGEASVADAIADEAIRLRWLAGRIETARMRSFTMEDGRAWLLTEALTGRSGDAWLDHDATLLPRIVDAFAGFLLRLHALDPDECPFRDDASLRIGYAKSRIAAGLVDEDDFDADHRGWGAARIIGEVERLLPMTCADTVTHGDFSLGNLILDGDMRVSGCIDVGRVGIADAYQDIAIFWQNLAEFGKATQQRFLDALGVPEPDADRLRFHRCLDELF